MPGEAAWSSREVTMPPTRKQPSLLARCFRGCARQLPESESSHFSVGNGPVSSGTVVSPFLSSFMSRSCSRGTWDYSSTDMQKPRNRTRGDADVVTLATARYLELFATNAKNDGASTVLSDAREAQDSLRSARTASENQVSRSSTLTARASREPSRLGCVTSAPSQPPPSLASLPASGIQRFHTPLASAQLYSASEIAAPTYLAGEGGGALLSQSGMPYPRKVDSAPNVSSLGPFTNKTRASALASSRCRSDRISPSTTAFLLPMPSIKGFTRAHTAIPATGAGCSKMITSTSLNDITLSPRDGESLGDSGGGGGAAQSRIRDHLSISATYISQTVLVGAADSRLVTPATGAGGGVRRHSCLQTGSDKAAQPDSSMAPQPWVESRQRLGMSSMAATGDNNVPRSARRRRPSIHFTRDGDVMVTGLPASCLTAGRAPWCDTDDLACGIAVPLAPSGAVSGNVSAPIHCSALDVGFNVFADSASNRAGGLGLARGRAAEPPSSYLRLRSQSNDPGSQNSATVAEDTSGAWKNSTSGFGVSVNQIRNQQHQLHQDRGCSGGGAGDGAALASCSASAGANAVFMRSEVIQCEASLQRRSCTISLEEPLAAEHDLYDVQQRPQQPQQRKLQEQGQGQDNRRDGKSGDRMDKQLEDRSRALPSLSPSPSPSVIPGLRHDTSEGSRLERYRIEGSQLLALAHCSSEGRRCDWGGSSNHGPSPCSESDHLMQGIVTGAQASACNHSNNPLEQYAFSALASMSPMGVQGPEAAAVPIAGPDPPACPAMPRQSFAAAFNAESRREIDNRVGERPVVSGRKAGTASYGQSLLVTEAHDVTSALTRLQEACMAAVAHVDLRSQRICHRMSMDTTRLFVKPASASLSFYDDSGGGSGGAFVRDHGSSMGPICGTATVMSCTAGAAAVASGPRGTAAASGTKSAPFRNSSSMPRMAAQGLYIPLPGLRENISSSGGGGSGGGGLTASASAGCPTQVESSVRTANGLALGPLEIGARTPGKLEAWEQEGCGSGCFGADRASPAAGGLVLDGEHLKLAEGHRIGDMESLAVGPCGEGPSVHPSRLFDDADGDGDDTGDEDRTRMLNNLLRGDFLHDTQEGVSEDEDDCVLEYRYGGFELGGGDNDCGLVRRASFLEAVRRCGTAKAASSSQAVTDLAVGPVAGGIHPPPRGTLHQRIRSLFSVAQSSAQP